MPQEPSPLVLLRFLRLMNYRDPRLAQTTTDEALFQFIESDIQRKKQRI